MAPIKSYHCGDCMYEFDKIVNNYDDDRVTACERCETGRAVRVPSLPAQARGNFGTVSRKQSSSAKPVAFNFPKSEK